MPVSFAQIPSNIKVPLYWVEVDPSMAGLPVIRQPSLLVGTMIAPGEAEPNVPIPIGSQAQADRNFGMGGELSRMFKAFFANNWGNEVWGVGLEPPTGSTQATGTITILRTADQAGTLWLYIGGELVRVQVGHTDTEAQIATNIARVINDDPTLPVTATAAVNVVTVTCVWAGDSGNDIRMDLNYYGGRGGEQTPLGLELEFSIPAAPPLPARPRGFLGGGAGTPSVIDTIMNMGEQPFEYVAIPWSDSTTLFLFQEEYGFGDNGRWGWRRQHFGHCFSAKRGSYMELRLWGETRNSGVMSVLGFEIASPSPCYEWVAAYTAKAQRALTNDPARPLQTLSLNRIKIAPLEERFNFIELNSLALHGIAIQKAGSDQQPMLAREQTTYQLNLYGQPDDAYELVTTLATLARLIRNQRHAITSRFPRHKLANDGTRFGVGQVIATPGLIKAELIAQYRIDEFNGLVEDIRNFKRHLIVERDPNDPNRVNVLYPPDLINQLRIFAVLAQFRLQYDRGIDVEISSAGRSAISGIR